MVYSILGYKYLLNPKSKELYSSLCLILHQECDCSGCELTGILCFLILAVCCIYIQFGCSDLERRLILNKLRVSQVIQFGCSDLECRLILNKLRVSQVIQFGCSDLERRLILNKLRVSQVIQFGCLDLERRLILNKLRVSQVIQFGCLDLERRLILNKLRVSQVIQSYYSQSNGLVESRQKNIFDKKVVQNRYTLTLI